MDMTQTIHLFGDIPTVITIIKEHLAREIGPFITVSVGVSYNKLLAKLASKKINQMDYLLSHQKIEELYMQYPVLRIYVVLEIILKKIKYKWYLYASSFRKNSTYKTYY